MVNGLKSPDSFPTAESTKFNLEVSTKPLLIIGSLIRGIKNHAPTPLALPDTFQKRSLDRLKWRNFGQHRIIRNRKNH